MNRSRKPTRSSNQLLICAAKFPLASRKSDSDGNLAGARCSSTGLTRAKPGLYSAEASGTMSSAANASRKIRPSAGRRRASDARCAASAICASELAETDKFPPIDGTNRQCSRCRRLLTCDRPPTTHQGGGAVYLLKNRCAHVQCSLRLARNGTLVLDGVAASVRTRHALGAAVTMATLVLAAVLLVLGAGAGVAALIFTIRLRRVLRYHTIALQHVTEQVSSARLDARLVEIVQQLRDLTKMLNDAFRASAFESFRADSGSPSDIILGALDTYERLDQNW